MFPPTRLLICTSLLLASLASRAQTHRVEAPEKVTRAVGVYEWTGDLAKPTAARLIPVTVFIEGAFQDGGTYYARPVPLALLNGNIYSLEKAGMPQGNMTLDYARHLQTAVAGSDNTIDLGWFGYGDFTPLRPARKAPPLKASTNVSAIASSKDPDRPTFVRRNTDATTAPASGSKTPAATTATDSAPDDPDRPHFSKAPTTETPPPDPADSKPATTAPDTTTSPAPTNTRQREDTRDPSNDTDRPTLRHRDPKQAEADRKARNNSSVTAIGSPDDDRDRPNMRRGATTGVGSAAPQLTGVPAGLHQIVAVSDAVTREPHPFAREWATPTERADILAKFGTIAQQQLADYARANSSAPAPSPAPAPKARAGAAARTRRPAAAPAPSTPVAAPLASEELTPYTLSYGGLPTFVYTAISTPPAPAGAPALPERYVTVVAQQIPSGELQVAFASVTDAGHLDRTPWFRLIDAVDPDAQHRASLLFELRGQTSRQFGLYRILSAKAEQIFVTNPAD